MRKIEETLSRCEGSLSEAKRLGKEIDRLSSERDERLALAKIYSDALHREREGREDV